MNVSFALEPAGLRVLPVSGEHAAKVFELPVLHRDPFDRLLLAQALSEPLTLLTDGSVLGQYGGFVTTPVQHSAQWRGAV